MTGERDTLAEELSEGICDRGRRQPLPARAAIAGRQLARDPCVSRESLGVRPWSAGRSGGGARTRISLDLGHPRPGRGPDSSSRCLTRYEGKPLPFSAVATPPSPGSSSAFKLQPPESLPSEEEQLPSGHSSCGWWDLLRATEAPGTDPACGERAGEGQRTSQGAGHRRGFCQAGALIWAPRFRGPCECPR